MTDRAAAGRREARRLLVSGRVQGVGFRHYTRVQASELGIAGTVRNLDDGRVEIHAVGDPATLDRFEERVRQGPRGGRVDHLEHETLEAQTATWDDFRVVR